MPEDAGGRLAPGEPTGRPPGWRCRHCGPNCWRPCPHEFTCPACQARPGTWCVRPSGHRAQDLHEERIALARAGWTPEQWAAELAWERANGQGPGEEALAGQQVLFGGAQ